METEGQQPSPPIPLADGEGATPTPPTPAAEVTLPGEPAVSGPPVDAYQPQWDDQTWQEQSQSVGMDRGELKRYYAPAREVFETFRVEPLMTDMEEAGMVSPADGIRAMGRLGEDIRVWREAHTRLMGSLPKGTAVNVAPLTGEALDRAVDNLARDYLPSDYARLSAAGVLQSQEFRQVAIRLAQEKHRYTSALPALEKAAGEHKAMQVGAREREAVAALVKQVGGMTESDYQFEVGSLYDQLAEANRQGRDTSVIKAKILRLGEARR